MEKRIFDEKNGLWYELQDGLYYPCIDEYTPSFTPVGKWGRLHTAFLKEYHEDVYRELWLTSRLHEYLLEIDTQAEAMMERLVEGMKQAQGIDDEMRSRLPDEWRGRMENIRSCAQEVVMEEIVCG